MGRTIRASLAMGCSGVWVGTRFIASDEAGAGPYHKKSVVNSGYSDTIRTTIYTGRPLRVFKTPYVQDWEVLTPTEKKAGVDLSKLQHMERSVRLTGQCAGAITDIKPAKAIVEEMVAQAVEQLNAANTFVVSKL